jgi:hypothetical protein
MTPREIKLAAALLANAKLRDQAERFLAAYVEPDSNRADIISELITLFDGPQRLAKDALAQSEGRS